MTRTKSEHLCDSAANCRRGEILSILELVKFARGEAVRLDLEFETYLLDMAALELADRYEQA